MIKKLYKHKGWIAAETQYLFQRVRVKLSVDSSKRFFCHRCGRRGYIHSVRTISITDLPCIGNDVEIALETPQIRCPRCGHFHTVRPDFVHPTMGFTWRFMHLISSLLVHVPARKLGKMFHLATTTVLRIDKAVLREALPTPDFDHLEGILVDEKYLGPSHGFVTLVLNARTGEPLHMAKGKDGAALESFYNKLTDKQKRSIKYLGIDRANAYRAATNQHLPWVKVCYDAYHLVSNMNGVVDKVRRAEFAHPTEAEKQRVAGKRYHLLRAREHLNDDTKAQLAELLAINKNLNITYILKEQFRHIFSQITENAAIWHLVRWIGMAVNSGVKQLVKFAENISDDFNEVINGIRYDINSGKIESANAGINRIQCKCCGLFDIEYLFMKMRQIYLMREYPYLQQI